jgi:predicted TIM-barrel enzyme
VAAHSDIVTLDFGWNIGGSVRVENSIDLEQSSALAVEFVGTVRATKARGEHATVQP